MALLDIRGLSTMPNGSWTVVQYCAITEQLLSGIRPINSPPDSYDPELNQHLKIYMESGNDVNSLGMRAPLIFWLVMCGWVSPQKVLAAVGSENSGDLAEEDLVRLFTDRWILDSLLEHWDPKWFTGRQPAQREYALTAARSTAAPQSYSKRRSRINERGSMVQIVNAQGVRSGFTVDEFTATASQWSQRHGHIGHAEAEQLTNEPALPAMLARPQIFKSAPGGFEGYQEAQIVSQRWRGLVKHSLRALAEKNAGPVTARLVFEGISKGLCYFQQERKR